MLFFSTRAKARNFAKGSKKVVDCGSDARKRWAVRIGNVGM